MGLAAFVGRVLERARDARVDRALLAPECIPGSLFSGAAGVAFFLYEMARLRRQPELLSSARRWWELADAWAATATPRDWRDLQHGFLIGEGGVAYVDALLSGAEGDPRRVLRAVERAGAPLLRLGSKFPLSELVGGAAGLACLALDLQARLPRAAAYQDARRLLARLRVGAIAHVERACIAPLAGDARLGAAHGVAGELWVLHGARALDGVHVPARLAELAALRQLDEAGLVFWSARRGRLDIELAGSWCNGLAGHSVLWTDVARQSCAAPHGDIARAIAESLARLPNRLPGMCCGLTGQALALQRFADLAGDARFARRAYERLARAAEIAEPMRDVLLSLWHGSLGVALVAEQRLHGIKCFPLLEPPA